MYFGAQILNEEKDNSSSGCSNMINVVSHLIKFTDSYQQQFQSSSWVDTIMQNHFQMVERDKAAGKGRTNYVKKLKEEFAKTGVKRINDILKENNTGIQITEVPAIYTYEFLLDTNNIISLLDQYVYTRSAKDQIIDKYHIHLSDEAIRRCKGH